MIPPIADRFVAGESVATALDHTRHLNNRDAGAILNLLGEHYEQEVPVDQDTEAYLDLLGDLAGTDLRARLSVKPSQLGLDVSRDLFETHLGRVVETADVTDRFVWVDMENPGTIEDTLAVVETLADQHPGTLGVCLQANVKRTEADLAALADVPCGVRLVKGAYEPPPDGGYRGSEAVNRAYRDRIEEAFRTFEGTIAVGTHDPAMIEHADRVAEEHGRSYEVQMLMGVNEDELFDLAADHEVWQYVPYGSKWLSYFYRRVAERRENLRFALQAIVSG